MQEESRRQQCVHQIFEAEAARRPEATALICGGEELSYGELNRRANRLAHHLLDLGLPPESVVALLMPRGFEMVVALLGVLKAGGAYLCLDPEYPPARLSFMLTDVRARFVLTERALAGTLPPGPARVVCLDEQREAIERRSAEEPRAWVTPEGLAYITYTSGSTGEPKGTEVPHRSVPGFARGVSYADFGPAQTFLQHSSTSWDALTLELWGPLLCGGRTALHPGKLASPEELAEAVRSHGVTSLWLTSSLFNAAVDSPADALGGLTQLLTGGEALSATHVRRALARWPHVRLVNGYGPSECTVFCSCQVVREPPGEQARSVPIGRPVGDRRVYLLDRRLRRVPVGVVGELYVGGPAVARGYRGRPSLTAERFVPDPYSQEPGARMYRTGDLVRFLTSGELEFVGRVDRQVKVRGFRIELGEVEAVLLRHPGVRRAAATVREDVPGERRVVAYVSGEGVTAGELREHLRGVMPEYMQPGAVVVLDELPLNAHGKVDYHSLPAPEEVSQQTDEDYVAPRTPVEEVLAGVWAEVLDVDRVGVNDNFFEVGGHSLLATRVTSRVREIFQVDLSLRTLFELPTLGSLAERIEEERRAGRQTPAPPITRARRDRRLPLSFAQQRLWFIDQIEAASSAYNVPLAVRLAGALDLRVLRQTLSEVVRRHEALRTTFAADGGEPAQLISEPGAVDLPLVDVSALPAREREAEVRRLVGEEARRPFDLRHGPLLRASLLRVSEDEHVALLTMHHIVSDGWSMWVLVGEVAALYEAYSAGRPSPLAELPVQYADYAVWQREYLTGEVLEEQLAYWRERLAGAPAALELPTDFPRPAVQSFRGAALHVEISPELTEGLRAVARREGVTLFMLCLAAWQLLLSRYTGQEDIVVGTPIANRTRAEVEPLIGFFVNTLVLRTDLSGEITFGELLRRVREVCLGAYAHQELPFERLVEELRPARDLSRNPLAQAVFALQNAPMRDLSLSGLTLSPLGSETNTVKFDLELHLVEDGERVWGNLAYNTDLFKAVTAGRMLDNFRHLLENIVADPGTRLPALSSLAEAEERRLLVEWNDTAVDYPRERCVHEIFEEAAGRAPDAPAVVSDGRVITYGELNRRAGQLAHYLRRRGVGPEATVGVMLERSAELIVALLGILKAGGAYVPLDPSYPKRRLELMLEDSGARVLLTRRSLAGALPDGRARLIDLDAEREAINDESPENPRGGATAENPACVIYTSGSTGTPKGVCLTHRSINRLVVNPNYMTLKPSDRVAQTSNFSFDAATFEIWGALLNGARLVIVPREVVLSADDLARHIREQDINVLFLTTALFNQMAYAIPHAFGSLDYLIFGGEASDPNAAREVLSQGRPKNLLHAYGPAESTTYTTCYRVSGIADGAATVPIGSPISNTHTYVMDASQRLVPAGAVGELYVGGEGLARGYLGRPALTAERFLPDPFSREPGARLYRTGDLVRHLADGNLEFVGRVDQQVKVRGFRVEPGEIEAVLGQHPAVRASSVAVLNGGPGEKRLVAYVVADKALSPKPAELRGYLKERLPDYMLPGAFMLLDSLPLTPNGKVDLRALPNPDGLRPELESAYAAPRTEAEQKIAALWQELLQVARVGIHDNFFDLGGHSLLLVKAHERLRRTFDAELTMVDMFRHPTVSALARHLSGGAADAEAGGEARQSEGEMAESLRRGKDRLSRRLSRGGVAAAGTNPYE